MALYLKLGTFKGNVTQEGYQDYIELESYSWGFSVALQTTVGAAGNRLSAGKVSPGDLHLIKRQDATSTDFMLYSLEGKPSQKAQLVVTMPSGTGGEDKYMEYVMENVLCSNFNVSGSQAGGEPMESISFNFTSIHFNQYLKDASNKPKPPVRGGYDFTTGKKV